MSEPFYIIGIDLGTTNTVVAYTEANIEKGKKPDIRVLQIPQISAPGTIESMDLLPSFIFLPEKHDVAKEALELPWGGDEKHCIGFFARGRGEEIPQRLISSSKSWLCNTMVDRNKAVLPWDGSDELVKLSPVQASSFILQHVMHAWNYIMASEDEHLKIEKQAVYLTVPASFDAVAKELTINAAKMAGLENVTLLEEPQAAFYAWIEASDEKWRDKVNKGDLILVCDVGGGTSDFSLIQVSEEQGELVLERMAVGDHLLVGGDNMDLTLAYFLANKLSKKKKKLDSWQMRGLSHSCRKAKENLFSDSNMSEHQVTILGRGSSLIGGTIKEQLTKTEVEQVVLDGFFPYCNFDVKPISNQKIGLQEIGLSYEADPGVTRHLAYFLSKHIKQQDDFMIPDAVFFNGGVMKSPALRNRVLDVISSWKNQEDSKLVKEIDNSDFDLSVAKGAAYYGLARRGNGIRIRSGLARSYYISLAASMPAIPGIPIPTKALCIAPYGMEEGSELSYKDKEFVLVVGEPVKFDILCSTVRYDDVVGTIVEDWEDEDQIEKMTSIESLLDGEYGNLIPVTIEVKTTELGTVEFWCVSVKDSKKRWKLEFNVREQER